MNLPPKIKYSPLTAKLRVTMGKSKTACAPKANPSRKTISGLRRYRANINICWSHTISISAKLKVLKPQAGKRKKLGDGLLTPPGFVFNPLRRHSGLYRPDPENARASRARAGVLFNGLCLGLTDLNGFWRARSGERRVGKECRCRRLR